MRRDQRLEPPPGNHAVHLRQQGLPPRDRPLLAKAINLGKASLQLRSPHMTVGVHTAGRVAQDLFRVSKEGFADIVIVWGYMDLRKIRRPGRRDR